MSSTVTQKFSDSFNSSDKEHVMWLKKLFEFAKNIATSRTPVEDIINKNPLNVKAEKTELMDWVHIHFCLAMKYSRDVLNGQAWVPSK
jgi:hypothetical protein